jgi:hypothetical protein
MVMSDSADKKKYGPLGEHLATLPPETTDLTLSFAEVEKIIGGTLPPSAFKHRAWWANQQYGSRAPHWREAGFAVDELDLPRRFVRFQRLGAPGGPPREMSLLEVVTIVNARVKGRPFGGLQEWRRKHKGLTRVSETVFPTGEPERDYVMHIGARSHSELQFNIGFDWDDDADMFRHGIAFSLETSRTMPDITLLLGKIARFNEYLRIYPDAFDGFSMWVWDERKSTPRDRARGETHPVASIPDELSRKGYFIFIGKLQPVDAIDVDMILDDLDRLLPVYEFVEGKETFPIRVAESERKGFVWSPDNKASSVTQVSYERIAKTVEMDLRHNVVRDALLAHLKKVHGAENATREQRTADGTLIDLAVRDGDRYTYYELKIYSSPQACIREALGQLLEYSFWPGANKAERLIIVGEAKLDVPGKTYLEYLRKEFALPVEYRQFDMKARCLV